MMCKRKKFIKTAAAVKTNYIHGLNIFFIVFSEDTLNFIYKSTSLKNASLVKKK